MTIPNGSRDLPIPSGQPGTQVLVESERDILVARQSASSLASAIGFGTTDAVTIATVVSELARNIVSYCGKGEIVLKTLSGRQGVGLEIIALDRGPGIQDVSQALKRGFSTGDGLGYGLGAVKSMADEFLIDSRIDTGTVITVRKWKKY